MEDSQIIQLLFQRSEGALEQLYEKYGRLCRSVAARILPDDRDAEECVADACMKAWDSIPPEKPRSLAAWMSRVVRNLALDRRDYNTAACRASCLMTAFEELEPFLPSAPDGTVESGEFRRVLNDFLRELPEQTRICFIRRYWYGESVREIAEACRLREGTVKSLLFRTRDRLRHTLAKEEIFV